MRRLQFVNSKNSFPLTGCWTLHKTRSATRRNAAVYSVARRRAFLCDPSHRIRVVYLPKHSSWLNQIEVVFGIAFRRVMRHGSFTNTDDLKSKLLKFIDYFNETFAKPFN